MNVAVFVPNWIGDAAMATPTLRAVRQHFGSEARVIGIMRPYVADVLSGTPWLDECWFYDPRSQDRALHSWPLIGRLRATRCDAALLLTNSLRTALLAWLGGVKRRVGFDRDGRGWLLTDRVQPHRVGRRFVPAPVLDDYLRLASALGCEHESTELELATLPEDETRADAVWSKLQLPPGAEVVALNTGGAFGAAKLWPVEYFAQLARQIATDLGRAVLVLCGPSEREQARQIAAAAQHPRVTSLADEPLSIGLTKACVRRAALLVSTDSGPRHFAAAFNVPVVTLFGPTHIAWSENHFPLATHVQLKLDCQPCQQRECPLGHHRCMRDLSVARVFAAVTESLSHARQARAA